MLQGDSNKNFDVSYGIASVSISATGITIIATTESFYHGAIMMASAAAITAKIYNASSGTSRMIDIILAPVTGTGTGGVNRYIPVVCKYGLSISVTGSGGDGVVFYSPKG